MRSCTRAEVNQSTLLPVHHYSFSFCSSLFISLVSSLFFFCSNFILLTDTYAKNYITPLTLRFFFHLKYLNTDFGIRMSVEFAVSGLPFKSSNPIMSHSFAFQHSSCNNAPSLQNLNLCLFMKSV